MARKKTIRHLEDRPGIDRTHDPGDLAHPGPGAAPGLGGGGTTTAWVLPPYPPGRRRPGRERKRGTTGTGSGIGGTSTGSVTGRSGAGSVRGGDGAYSAAAAAAAAVVEAGRSGTAWCRSHRPESRRRSRTSASSPARLRFDGGQTARSGSTGSTPVPSASAGIDAAGDQQGALASGALARANGGSVRSFRSRRAARCHRGSHRHPRVVDGMRAAVHIVAVAARLSVPVAGHARRARPAPGSTSAGARPHPPLVTASARSSSATAATVPVRGRQPQVTGPAARFHRRSPRTMAARATAVAAPTGTVTLTVPSASV